MKILYLHQYFKTNASAGGTRSYEFAKYLSDNGITVEVITGTELESDKNINNNLSIYSTNTKYSNNMSKWRRIYSFLEYNIKSFYHGLMTRDVDIIFATSTPLTIGLPAVLLAKIKRKKLIFEVRDVWPDIPIELGYIKNKLLIKLLKLFEMWIYKNSTRIIVLSTGMFKNLVNKGVTKGKITVIENMCNLYLYDHITRSEQNDAFLKNKFICIHPGTMGHVNGLDFLLDVAKYVIPYDKDIVFLLIGEGKKKEHLKSRVRNENLTNVVIKDSVPKKKIAQIIKTSDIGIMCVDNQYKILEDNSANKFFDFLAAELPILINYGGWQKEVIENANCGIANFTPESMARTIIELKKDRNLMFEMSKNSGTLASSNYSDSIAKNKLLNVIQSI